MAPSSDPSPSGEGDTPSPHPSPLGAVVVTPPQKILVTGLSSHLIFCLEHAFTSGPSCFGIPPENAFGILPIRYFDPHWLPYRQDGTVDDDLTSTVKT